MLKQTFTQSVCEEQREFLERYAVVLLFIVFFLLLSFVLVVIDSVNRFVETQHFDTYLHTVMFPPNPEEEEKEEEKEKEKEDEEESIHNKKQQKIDGDTDMQQMPLNDVETTSQLSVKQLDDTNINTNM